MSGDMVDPIASEQIGVAVHAMHFFRNPDPERRLILVVADTNGKIHPLHGLGEVGGENGGELVVLKPSHPVRMLGLTHLPRPTGWPDLVAVNGDSVIRTYDVSLFDKPPQLLSSLPRGEELRAVATLSDPDGSAVIAVAGEGDVVFLCRDEGRRLERLEGHTGPVRVLNSLRVERCLAVADERGITFWDLSGPRARRRWFRPGRSRALSVLREHGEVRLVSAAADGIHLWDARTGQHVAHFAQRLSVATMVAFDAEPGEQMLAVASDQVIELWSPATEERARTQLNLPTQAGKAVGRPKVLTRILTGKGTLLAAGDDLGNVTVWLLTPQRQTVHQVGTHDDWVNDLAVVVQSEQVLLASASDDRTIRLWNVAEANPHKRIRLPTQVQKLVQVDGDLGIGDQLGYVRRRSIDGDSSRWEKQTEHGPVRAMASFRTPDGWRIVSAGESGHCLIWDGESGDIRHHLRPTTAGGRLDQAVVRAVAVAQLADGWLVAAGDLSGKIEVWNAITGEVYWPLFDAHPGEQVRSLACVYADGRPLLASGSSSGVIRLWDLARQARVGSTNAHSGQVSALCPLRSGLGWLLASGGADRDIRLWNPDDFTSPPGESVKPLSEIVNAHEGWVRALAQVSFSEPGVQPSDGGVQLASGGEEGSIRLWQVQDGQLVLSTYGPSIRGFRDRLAEVDLLSRDAITTELLSLLRPASRDQPATRAASGPQVVLIHGAWGTGKSSLMRRLRDGLDKAASSSPPAGERFSLPPLAARIVEPIRTRWRERELSPRTVNRVASTGNQVDIPPRADASRTITVWFNPWAHQSSEQVWSGLAWAIVEATRDRLGVRKAERQRYWLSRNLHRLDRGALRRSIHFRIWRPFLVTIAALVLPLALTLSRIGAGQAEQAGDVGLPSLQQWLELLRGREVVFPGAQTPGLLGVSLADLLTATLGLALVGVLVVMGSFSLWQYWFGRATAHLPADIFEGPIDQAAVAPAAGNTAGERLLRDQPYISAAGRLHSINYDIERLIEDLDARGHQLVVFIDDLDRCASQSTVEVFEAINAFLSDQIYPDSAPRFVIGLDSTVVANRLTAGYADVAAVSSLSDPDDPNIGWSILRKLSQLTVVLPAVQLTHTARLMRQHSDSPAVADGETSPAQTPSGRMSLVRGWFTRSPGGRTGPDSSASPVAGRTAAVGTSRDDGRRQAASNPTVDAAAAVSTEPKFLALEREPAVRAHLRALIKLRPRQTMRETKRLLTLWGFYVRLLGHLQPPGPGRLPGSQPQATVSVQDACDAMTLAEIVCRWPALVPALGRTGEGPSGLATLIQAASQETGSRVRRIVLRVVDRYRTRSAEASTRTWRAALRMLGLDDTVYEHAAANLYRLLRRHGNETVARFADLLL